MPGEMRGKVFMKIHRTQGETMIAICDQRLLGKTFRQGKLKMTVNKRFYGGRLVDVDDCDPYLEEATIANLVGEHSVAKGVKLGLIDDSNVIKVGGIPHAQMIRVFL